MSKKKPIMQDSFAVNIRCPQKMLAVFDHYCERQGAERACVIRQLMEAYNAANDKCAQFDQVMQIPLTLKTFIVVEAPDKPESKKGSK